MARGGKTQPANPAPVSGPGALSQRTDGGPGNAGQPIRVAPGGTYGSGVAAEAQQKAAPMAVADEGGLPASRGAGMPAETPPMPPSTGVFGPTERPGESPLAGAMSGGQAVAEDVDAFLNILYSKFPHPQIAYLLDKG